MEDTMGMVMKLPIYQDRAKGIWWFRKRVPTELISAYQEHTKKKVAVVKVSLGVRDEKTAQELGVKQLEQYNDLVRYLRSRAHLSPAGIRRAKIDLMLGGMTKWMKRTIDLEFIRKLKKVVEDELAAMTARMKAEGKNVWINPQPKFRRKEMRLPDYIKYLQNNLRLLHIHERMFLEPGFNPVKELAETNAYLEDNEIKLRDHILKSIMQGQLQDKSKATNPAAVISGKPTITKAVDLWIAKRNPRQRSIGEWHYAVKRFVELHGDLAVDAIEDSHIVEFRQALAKVPSRLPLSLRDKPLPELVSLANTGKLTGKGKERSPAAINKLLVALTSILEVMHEDGVISRNPAKKKLLAKDDDGTGRPPYEIAELKKLFTSDLYASDYWSSPARAENRPSHYWMPLIALYTGFRIEEISQLKVSDIREESGIPYFSINIQHKRKRKSKAAIREVVIHNELVKAGFMRFVQEQKRHGRDQLFHDRTKTADNRLSGSMSNWYRRYADRIGIRNDGKTFHSLRDNFNDACENADLTDRQITRIMGHALEGAKKHYGKGLWLKTTARLMERVQYPELDLSHLYIFNSVEKAMVEYKKREAAPVAAATVRKKPRLVKSPRN